MQNKTLHDRLSIASRGLSYRRIAKLTEVHPETARRYMQGQSPSVEFVTAFCDQLSISPAWLLNGSGPMQADQVRSHALRQTRPGELLAALGGVLDRLSDRVAYLETNFQTLGNGPQPNPGSDAEGPSASPSTTHGHSAGGEGGRSIMPNQISDAA